MWRGPFISARQAEYRQRGLNQRLDFFDLPRSDVPWISMETDGAAIPVDVIPPNVTSAGPILLSSVPAAEMDPEVAAWMEKAPTVLVNLGSLVTVGSLLSAPCAGG